MTTIYAKLMDLKIYLMYGHIYVFLCILSLHVYIFLKYCLLCISVFAPLALALTVHPSLVFLLGDMHEQKIQKREKNVNFVRCYQESNEVRTVT